MSILLVFPAAFGFSFLLRALARHVGALKGYSVSEVNAILYSAGLSQMINPKPSSSDL
jgi:hypothetical protein